MLDRVGHVDADAADRKELSERTFLPRVGLIVLVGAIAFLVWRLFDVLLLSFGAVLLALALRGTACALTHRTPIPEVWAVAPVVLGLLAAVGGVGWLFGTQISAQFDLLAEDLPQSAGQLVRDIGSKPWGQWFLNQVHGANMAAATGQFAGHIASVFGSVFRALAYLAVMFVAAVYLAAQPERYRHGLLRLVPSRRRPCTEEVLDLIGATLQRWIIGQCFTMVVVGTLTTLGLWMFGIGAPIAMGLIAGVFAFVPYVGPIFASVPGLLMAAAQGPAAVLYAAALYGGVHFVEGNFVTPLVQAEAVELPPVLTIFGALAFGVLLGPPGVLLSAPLAVTLLVAVNALYIEGTLGEQRAWPATHRPGGHG